MSKLVTNSVQSFSKGTVVFVSGDVATDAYYILDGTVVVTQNSKQIYLESGGIIGELALLKGIPHYYAAVCATDVRALKITKDNMQTIVLSQPQVATALLYELAEQVEKEDMIFTQGLRENNKPQSDSDERILPEGHPTFDQLVPAEHNEYLFPTNVECHICKTPFSGLRTRVTRLQLEEQRTDFRTVYRNFEPNFYYIWVCPCCSFAYPERQYKKLSRSAINKAKKEWQKNPPKGGFEFDAQRSINQVLESYYLTIRSFNATDATCEQWANLWLRLLWIYEDLDEKELAFEAAKKSRDHFAEAMSTVARSAAGDQQLYIILAELDLRLDDQGSAFKNFHAAATMVGGDPRNKRIATDRIQDLRNR